MTRLAVPRIAKGAVFAFLFVATTGCFASLAQLDEVHQEVAVTRAETATADSVRAMQLVQILSTLRAVNDSIASLNSRLTRLRAETQADVRSMRQEVNQILEVSGRSEQRLKELRSQVDSRIRQTPPSTAPAAPTAPPTDTVAVPAAPVDDAPAAEELYRIGRDQLTRGGNSAARAAFMDLLKRYPDSELAADAQFLLAESYAADGTNAAADAAYAIVVSKYAESPRAPTALYKRGVLAQTARRTTAAKRLYNDLIQRYPSSDEAELARERLRVMN
ncbi:MAG: tol-pal system protein YbgF [Gemmatimonadaceae bacterium]|nr:tol-pal system protein YbgF [Gemmatimonadaceae bacterium]